MVQKLAAVYSVVWVVAAIHSGTDSGYTSTLDGLAISTNIAGTHCQGSSGNKRSSSKANAMEDIPEPPPKP